MNVDFSPVFVEVLCAHRIFAAAGVPMDDVYVVPRCIDPITGMESVGVLAASGDLTFVITVGALDLPERVFRKRWAEVVAAYQELSCEAAHALTDCAAVRSRAAEIFAAMSAKGFSISRGDLH